MPTRLSIEALKALQLPQREVSALEADAGRLVYAGLEYLHIDHSECVPFMHCLRSTRPTLVMVENRFRSYYAADPDFRRFEQEPSAFGFTATVVPRTDLTIYLSSGRPRP